MYKYINYYKQGYKEGLKDAYSDYLNKKIKNFKKIDNNIIKSKLYDIGYIDGYKKRMNYLFKLK